LTTIVTKYPVYTAQ